MQITLTFDSITNRNAFATKTGYATAETTTVTVAPGLLTMAKAALGFGMAAQVDATGDQEFVVYAEAVADLTGLCTVVETLGDNFYKVTASDYVALHTALDGKVESTTANIKLLSELFGTPVTDITTSDAQWARIRVASIYRPFPAAFDRVTTTPVRLPEVIVMDSGINAAHAEFAGVTVEDFYKLPSFADYSDEAGHGTAVASAIAGVNLGVCTHVKLVNCKVFTATYRPTLLELGVALDAIIARQSADPTTARVINCSWGTNTSAYLNNKFQTLINAGALVVAAAGNTGIDVAELTPAGLANAITVAASDSDDVAAGFNDFAAADATIVTNEGRFLDFFAPGVSVTTAERTGGYMKVSGSSVSAGFASGVAADLLGLLPTWPQSFSTVIDYLNADATKGVLLLDPDKFTANQNRLVHLLSGSIDSSFTQDYYLGAINATTTELTGNILSHVIVPDFTNSSVYSVVIPDSALAAYSPFIAVSATGDFVVSTPTIAIADGVPVQLVRFKIRATSDVATVDSPSLIFFHVNPNYSGDVATDISAILEDLNSQSFAEMWASYSLK